MDTKERAGTWGGGGGYRNLNSIKFIKISHTTTKLVKMFSFKSCINIFEFHVYFESKV
jgi:hypothetical protein